MHIFVKDESELVQIRLYTYYRVVVGSNPVQACYGTYSSGRGKFHLKLNLYWNLDFTLV